jgi:outer membrane protein OmpA-like peptidoglycan-associated protein
MSRQTTAFQDRNMKLTRTVLSPFVVAAALIANASPSRVAAQPAGTAELGVLGRYTIMADKLGVENMPAGGGRLGLFFYRNLEAEAELTYGRADVKDKTAFLTKYSDPLWNYRLTYNAPFGGSNAFLIGGGYAYDAFGYAREKPRRAGGPSGLLGVRVGLGNHWSVRVEGHGHYALKVDPDTKVGTPAQEAYSNVGVQAGLSYSFQPFFRTREVVREVPGRETVRTDTVFRDRIAPAPAPTAAAPPVHSTVIIGVVNFAFAKSDLSNDAKRILDDIAASLAKPDNGSINIEVRGFTDAIGGEKPNVTLAQNRARSVADYLKGHGVPDARIKVEALGKSEPAADNRTAEGRATNRRVLISIIR